MRLFADVENYELDKAQAAMAYIANKEYPDSFYLYLDYSYASNLMDELGDLPAAIEYQAKALERDASKQSGYKQLATLYRRNKQYDEGITTYKKYLEVLGDKSTTQDLFGLGQQYLAASQQPDSIIGVEKKAEYVQAGDAIFAEIQAQKPDAYSAVLMRAAINITDGTKPEEKVKNYYEEALKLMEGKEGIDSSKLQALNYLAFYYVQTDDLDNARIYTDMILAIDPEHRTGKTIDSYLKSMEK